MEEYNSFMTADVEDIQTQMRVRLLSHEAPKEGRGRVCPLLQYSEILFPL